MIIAGIDEAGRGSVLGPLVMSLVCLPKDKIPLLEKLGVRDSKLVSRASRKILQSKIKRLTQKHGGIVLVKSIQAEQIDRFRQISPEKRLDELERQIACSLLNQLFSKKSFEQEKILIIFDGKTIFEPLRHSPFLHSKAIIQAENHADHKYPIVSGASIIAKYHRDHSLQKILGKYEKEFGPIQGNGYPNSGTKKFLIEYRKRYGHYPVEARTTWKTLKNLDHPVQESLPFPKA